MEYRSGSIFIRQPNHLLPTGHVVHGHEHSKPHTTFFPSGLWLVEQSAKSFNNDGTPDLDAKGLQKYHKLRSVKIRGGAPGSFLLIEADKRHRLELLEGPGLYMCVFSHYTPDGELSEEYTGWHEAYE